VTQCCLGIGHYAIAARFTDQSTGQVVLVAAGIAGSGIRAAGEFLTDEASQPVLAVVGNRYPVPESLESLVPESLPRSR